MNRIPIGRVRELAELAGGRGAIVFAWDADGRFSATSYGATREECAELRRTLDDIADALEGGIVHTPTLGRRK